MIDTSMRGPRERCQANTAPAVERDSLAGELEFVEMGIGKIQAEWQVIFLTHNLLKLFRVV